MMKYDVIVAGAGPSGICSAIAAARQGAKVALIERYGVIGGNLTAGYVGPILGSVGKGTMRDEICELLGVLDNDWIGEQGNAHNFEEAKLTLAELVAKESNIDVYLQTAVFDVIKDGNKVKGLICASNEGPLRFEAPVTIDCTGDGLVAFMAGASLAWHSESERLSVEDYSKLMPQGGVAPVFLLKVEGDAICRGRRTDAAGDS